MTQWVMYEYDTNWITTTKEVLLSPQGNIEIINEGKQTDKYVFHTQFITYELSIYRHIFCKYTV